MAIARKTLQVVPSLLAADFGRLSEAVQLAKDGGTDWVSVDVMDGHFVPNLSFGPEQVAAVKRCCGSVFVDAHLMVDNPETVAPWFIKAGADVVTVHLEATGDPRALLRAIRAAGKKSGLAIKPKTPVEPLLELLPDMDLALVMTVEPGFGGARFMPDMMPKVAAIRRAVDEKGLDCWVQVDGGINLDTIGTAAAAGADSLVAGSAVYGKKDPAGAVRELRARAEQALKS